MEFKVKRNILAKTLSNLIKVIPPKSTYTILQNIIIEAKKNNLLIQATDLDVFVKKAIPAEIKEEGKVLVPGKKILEITRAANTEDVGFKLKELKLHIRTGNAQFDIPSLDYQEFPDVPTFPEKVWFDLTAGELENMVTSTGFMVAKDISRRPMNGVLMQIKASKLRMVTTDGARLAMITQDKKGTSGDLIIATKVFDLLDFSSPEEKIEIFSEERMMGIKTSSTTIIARLIEGPYPNYEGVIPKEFSGTCTIEKEILDGALNRMVLVAPPHIKNVKFDFMEKSIHLTASSPDQGEASEQVPCVYDGERLSIWFNAGYVLEILRHLTTTDAVFQLTTQSSAAIVRPKSEEDLMYLLMPLRIDNWE